MSAVARVAQLDLRTVRPYRTQMLIMLVMAPLLGALWRQPTVVPVILVVMGSIVAAYPFAIGEKNDLDTLHGVLPVRRRSVVVGRYWFAVVLAALAGAAGSVVGLGLAALVGEPYGWPEAGYLMVAAFAVFAVLVAFQFPVYFALGYTRARLMSFLPIFGMSGVTLLAMDTLPSRSLTLPSPMLLVTGALAVSAGLLAGSAALAVRLDARRVR